MKRQLSVLLLVICIVSFVLPFSASASEMTCKVRFMLRYPGGAGDVACADPVEVVCGECLGDLLPDEPEPPAEGLVFLGWVDKYGEAVTEETVVSDDMRIYTAWGKLLTISFDANEGSWGDADFTELEALSGPVEELPEEPERDGYVFDSWNTKPDGSGEKFDIGRDLQENTTVYAQWKRIFSLYFYVNADEYAPDEDFCEEYTAEAPGILAHDFPVPDWKREGFTLLCWNTEPDGSGDRVEVGGTFRVDADSEPAELYAVWEAVVCRVTFDGLGQTAECAWGESLAALPEPEPMEGFRFGGWMTGENGTGESVNEDTPIREDLKLYPNWIRQVEVCFIIENGLWEETGESAYSVILDIGAPLAGHLPVPVPNEDFSENGTWEPDPTAQCAAQDRAYTLTLAPLPVCRVTFAGAGEIRVVEGKTVTQLPEPVLEGWQFLGWFTDAVNGEAFTTNTPVVGDLTLYPHWRKIFTLTLDPSGGSEYPSPEPFVATDTAVTEHIFNLPAAVPVLANHSFLGWSTDAQAETAQFQPGDTVTVSDTLTLYALWLRDLSDFTLRFDPNGGEGGPESLVAQARADSHGFTVPETYPARPGYTFQGWAEEPTAGTAKYHCGETVSVTGELTLYAVWKEVPKEVTVLFLDREVELVSLTLEYGTAPGGKMPENPARSGFRFLGWNTAPDGSGISLDSTTVVTEHLTAYAQWERIETAVVIFVNGEEQLDSLTLEAGSSLGKSLPTPPERKGWIFLGWNTKSDGSGSAVGETTPIQESLTLHAIWERITRADLIFMDGDAELCRITLDIGAKAGENIPEEPSRNGCRFLGWNTRLDGTGKKLTKSTVIREELTVYAQWEEIQYVTVTFCDRGIELDSITLEAGKKLGDSFPGNPTRAGFTFKGWNTQPKGGGKKLYKTTAIKEDMEVYAQWARRSGSNASTGDHRNIHLWTAVMVLSALTLACGTVYIFKKRK